MTQPTTGPQARSLAETGYDTLLFEAVLYAVDLAAYGFEQAALHLVDAASELWSEIYDYYDTGYQLTEQQTLFDDGTSEVIVYDVDNAQSWAEWIRTYDAPAANDDQATTAEDTPLINIDVLANDSDGDGDTLAIDGTPTADHGTVTVNADGTLNYTPDADFNGTDTITYAVSDGNGGSATGSVDVTVTPVNDAPVANDDQATTAEDTPLINIDVLANDSDGDGDTLAIDGTPDGRPRHRHRQCRRHPQLHAGRRLQRHRHDHLRRQRRQPELSRSPSATGSVDVTVTVTRRRRRFRHGRPERIGRSRHCRPDRGNRQRRRCRRRHLFEYRTRVRLGLRRHLCRRRLFLRQWRRRHVQ
jgi:hypothetical protein